ncbi:hypothetical protein IT403_01615 [Candidatus Nomurabacteria bacterium]|nr:hypothetical protein [Candidatus Nomurabacteria bacterium]
MLKKLGKEVLFGIALIFLVNILAMHFHWYGTVWWFDMPMHFAGGAWIAFVYYSVYINLRASGRIQKIHLSRLVFGMIATTVLVGGIWELFEFSVDAITLADLANPIDSISDMFFDTAGAVFVALCGVYRLKNVIE